MTTLPLTVLSQNNLKITVAWTPPAGVAGYVFSRDGQRVSSTFDPAKSQVTFGIPDGQPHTFAVEALGALASGSVGVNQPPPPPTSGAPPVWEGWPPTGQWEYVGVKIGQPNSPPISDRVTVGGSIDGISPPKGETSFMRIRTLPKDQYLGTSGWRTLAREFDPATKTFGPGERTCYAFAVNVPADYPGDGHMYANLIMHQTHADYLGTDPTGPAPLNFTINGPSIGVRVSGGKDGAKVDYVSQSVLSGYPRKTWLVFAIDYLHDYTAGAFGLWYAQAGQGPLRPLIERTGIGTMFEGTRNYPQFGLYRAPSGLSTTTMYMTRIPRFSKIADAVAFANQLAG